jgi:quercetin dioxygenase-like cupin family protein
MSTTTGAYLFQAGESELRWMGETTSTYFLATGASTGDAFALVEEKARSGVSVPLHKHDEDVESFYVLEGEMSFFLGHQSEVHARAGAFVHIPAGTVHGFRIDSESARYLILTTPRHALFYRAISSPSPLTPIDGALISAACKEYGIDFVGPLP